MGIRSDVGVALRNQAIEELQAKAMEVWDWLNKNRDEHQNDEDGELFLFRSWKWYRHDQGYKDIDALYAALDELNKSEYLVREACFDYPSSEDGDVGSWDDNPWDLCRSVSVNLNV